jgi:F0F1-type ATP synthase assembly protein I
MLRQFGVLIAAISQLFVMVIVGFFVGNWLDSWLVITPMCTILFALFGIILGFRNLIYVVRKNQNSNPHS